MNINQYVAQSPSRATVVGQTYGLLSIGLIISTIAASASLGTQLSFGMILGLFVGQLVLLFGALFGRESIFGLLCYFGFTGLMGYMAGPTVQHYLNLPHGSMIVMEALGTTAIATIGLSTYAFVSGRSFNQIGGFLFAGLLIIIVAGLANALFFHSPLADLTIACVSALVFCGYILYDTSRILNGEIDSPVHGAVSIFLDVFNLFLDLLRIFASVSGDD